MSNATRNAKSNADASIPSRPSELDHQHVRRLVELMEHAAENDLAGVYLKGNDLRQVLGVMRQAEGKIFPTGPELEAQRQRVEAMKEADPERVAELARASRPFENKYT